MRISRNGLAAVLLWAGSAVAAQPHVAELGQVMLDGDTGKVSGDIEVDGELIGTFEYRIGKAQFVDGKVMMTGTLTAHVEQGSSVVGNVRMALTEPEEVCDSVMVTPQAQLPLEALGLVVPAQEVEADILAKTSHGLANTALLCAAVHAADADDKQLLPQFSAALSALASRSLAVAARGPAVASVTPSVVERPAAPEVVAPQPARPVVQPARVVGPRTVVNAPQPVVTQPVEAEVAPAAPVAKPRRAAPRQLPAAPPPNDPTSDSEEVIPSGY